MGEPATAVVGAVPVVRPATVPTLAFRRFSEGSLLNVAGLLRHKLVLFANLAILLACEQGLAMALRDDRLAALLESADLVELGKLRPWLVRVFVQIPEIAFYAVAMLASLGRMYRNRLPVSPSAEDYMLVLHRRYHLFLGE